VERVRDSVEVEAVERAHKHLNRRISGTLTRQDEKFDAGVAAVAVDLQRASMRMAG
jgi:hypothetical protein